MPEMQHRNRKLLLILANVLTPAAILTFAIGFFPYKAFLPGLAEYPLAEHGSPPAAPFDRVIFMVIDALRRYVEATITRLTNML